MNSGFDFSKDDLKIDCESEIEEISSQLVKNILRKYKKDGFVLGLSGGIDSSVVAALCARVVSNVNVLGLMMPERESSPDTLYFSELIADHLEIKTVHFDITDLLEKVGCYHIRDNAIRTLIPEYNSDYKCKIVLPGFLENETYRLHSIVVESPDGERKKKRLNKRTFFDVLSASNFKQRVRKMMEYYHADRLNYAVAGTPNRLEYDQGFFVKLGDGSADTKPIAHLYKTQVYELAEFLGLPREIRERSPTTDTFSMEQSQEEFFFSLPYEKLDICLFGKDNGVAINQVASAAELTVDQVERVYRDIESKRGASEYLRAEPHLVEDMAMRLNR